MQAHELSQYFRMPEMVDFRQYVRTLPTNTLMGFGAFAALTTFWYATRPRALKPPCDLAMQSVQVAGNEEAVSTRAGKDERQQRRDEPKGKLQGQSKRKAVQEGQGSDGARRSVLLDSDEPLVYFYDDVRTLYEGFQRGIQLSNNGPCLGSRKPDQPYEWLSYKQWVIIEQGCFAYSMVIVPLYDTLGTEAITYIINKAELSLVFVDKPGKANLLLEGIENKLTPSLKTIVLMDSYGSNLSERGKKCGVEIISMKAMEDLGRANKRKPKVSFEKELFLSGTWNFCPLTLFCSYAFTGNPKGALITHRNVVSDCSAFIKMTEGAFVPSSDDTLISFLPLAHMFEKVVECMMLCHGAKIGFFQGDIRLLMDDLKTLQPTIFPVVPRLLNRMFDRANTTLKRWLLDFASKRKEAELRSGIIRNNSLWDKLIFHKIQPLAPHPLPSPLSLPCKSSLGGKVRLMITGAAPVSATVLTFLRAALGCQFYEGYGQTECTAGCCLTVPGDWTAGHVGAPMPCNIIKLVDVEEMNYVAAKGEGEVCVKGANVFQGYLKDPANTAEALDKDGWLHTGDIGKWLPNGTLKIIDRKKHIFKLAQGEYIAPEKIENIYQRSEPIAQVFVHGESLQAFLIAIVIPDLETLGPWARKRGFEGSFEELCRNKGVQKAILEDMVRLGKDSGLKAFEQVKGISLHSELFSVDNGLLTPTMKAKRPELRNYFRSQINELYSTIKI
ncbi:hypothetical protein E2I00_001850 [Balaenoptera physalus]|uniref:Arachidonate--CoA ligase n=1 Tax=Balaenoptera physalus TaxID=9770 RepID=A0A6A1QKG4_BALPH|nr:hypothetical protein E2I00_001850 [Balaenoptera physalus]